MPFFDLIHQDKNSHARVGVIHTDHGDIETPIFMPVGTQGTVKTLDQTDLKNIGAQIILGNTYHLHLRPGEDLIAEQGGLHKFMSWDGPILTDSGGFQVFSLGLQKDKKNTKTDVANVTPSPVSPLKGGEEMAAPLFKEGTGGGQARLVEIDEDGVTFRSYIDGSTHRFTPEIAIDIQHKLGADIIMAFDECTPDTAPEQYVREAMERTHRWAERSLTHHRSRAIPRLGGVAISTPLKATLSIGRRVGVGETVAWPDTQRPHPPQAAAFPAQAGNRPTSDLSYHQFLFGIIQGSNYRHLREESAKFISALDFDGIAIGGESIGYNMEATANILDWVYPFMPANKPHYAMGVGLHPIDLLIAVKHGVDMFDCVAPTRLARHGMFLVHNARNKHRLNITNAAFAKDTRPVDETCQCLTCKKYTRSYLHHLFAAEEISGMRLASMHNLYFLLDLMKQTREAITEDRFNELKQKWEL